MSLWPASRLASLAGCGSGAGESESKMTSYSSGETKADTAELFTVPQDQMAHVQVVTGGEIATCRAFCI